MLSHLTHLLRRMVRILCRPRRTSSRATSFITRFNLGSQVMQAWKPIQIELYYNAGAGLHSSGRQSVSGFKMQHQTRCNWVSLPDQSVWQRSILIEICRMIGYVTIVGPSMKKYNTRGLSMLPRGAHATVKMHCVDSHWVVSDYLWFSFICYWLSLIHWLFIDCPWFSLILNWLSLTFLDLSLIFIEYLLIVFLARSTDSQASRTHKTH